MPDKKIAINENVNKLNEALFFLLNNGSKDLALSEIADAFSRHADEAYYQDDQETWSSFQRVVRIIRAL